MKCAKRQIIVALLNTVVDVKQHFELSEKAIIGVQNG
jgi:hypothetical protein